MRTISKTPSASLASSIALAIRKERRRRGLWLQMAKRRFGISLEPGWTVLDHHDVWSGEMAIEITHEGVRVH
jgi:hypothetical protein